MTAWLGIILLVIAAIILMLRADGSTIGGLEQGEFAGIVTGIALLIFIGGGTLMSYRGQGSRMIKDIAIWLAIALALIIAYSFRFEFETVARRVAGELMPGLVNSSYQDGNGESVVEIPKRINGHYVTRVRVNGASIEMMVDTGASGVVLTQQDAQRAGIDISRLFYSVPVSTANGQAMVAMVRLQAISIGGISARNLQAHIAQPGSLSQSLLGMSFLSRLRSYEVKNGVLILRR
ncbi:MAG: TIGR02281 family clan AA aspartic protease [bacterium]|nr:TIGR02281 family clan AA aspartic protease [bacterium]